MNLLAATGIASKVGKRVKQLPKLADRVNAWSQQYFGDDVLQLEYFQQSSIITGIELNPAYRITGGGFLPGWNPFPGVGSFWVERWEPRTDPDYPDALKFLGSSRFGLCGTDKFDRLGDELKSQLS